MSQTTEASDRDKLIEAGRKRLERFRNKKKVRANSLPGSGRVVEDSSDASTEPKLDDIYRSSNQTRSPAERYELRESNSDSHSNEHPVAQSDKLDCESHGGNGRSSENGQLLHQHVEDQAGIRAVASSSNTEDIPAGTGANKKKKKKKKKKRGSGSSGEHGASNGAEQSEPGCSGSEQVPEIIRERTTAEQQSRLEQQRLHAEAEQQLVEHESQREPQRLAEEAERKWLAEAEHTRLADEAEKQENAQAEQQRLAEEIEQQRLHTEEQRLAAHGAQVAAKRSEHDRQDDLSSTFGSELLSPGSPCEIEGVRRVVNRDPGRDALSAVRGQVAQRDTAIAAGADHLQRVLTDVSARVSSTKLARVSTALANVWMFSAAPGSAALSRLEFPGTVVEGRGEREEFTENACAQTEWGLGLGPLPPYVMDGITAAAQGGGCNRLRGLAYDPFEGMEWASSSGSFPPSSRPQDLEYGASSRKSASSPIGLQSVVAELTRENDQLSRRADAQGLALARLASDKDVYVAERNALVHQHRADEKAWRQALEEKTELATSLKTMLAELLAVSTPNPVPLPPLPHSPHPDSALSPPIPCLNVAASPSPPPCPHRPTSAPAPGQPPSPSESSKPAQATQQPHDPPAPPNRVQPPPPLLRAAVPSTQTAALAALHQPSVSPPAAPPPPSATAAAAPVAATVFPRPRHSGVIGPIAAPPPWSATAAIQRAPDWRPPGQPRPPAPPQAWSLIKGLLDVVTLGWTRKSRRQEESLMLLLML